MIVDWDDGEEARGTELDGGAGAGLFFVVDWDDREGARETELDGGAGAGAGLFFLVGWDDGEEVRGTKSHDDVISASFNTTSLIGADVDRFWSSSSWVPNSGLK